MTVDVSTELQERFVGYARALALDIAKGIPGADRDEMIASAYLGLAQAAGAFDPSAGASFETFAYYRIRGAVFDGLRKSTGLPRRLRARIAAEAGVDALAQEAGRESGASAAEAAESFELAVRGVGLVFAASGLSGERALPEAESPAAAQEAVEMRETVERLRRAVAELPDDLRRVIESVYMEQRTMTECAAELGVHKSTFSRQHARAISALQSRLAGVMPA